MRGLQTDVRRLRKAIFAEIANLAYDSENIIDDIEAIPFKLTAGEMPRYRESIYRERAIIRESVRLGMGLSIRPENKPVHLTAGIQNSDIAEKYYEPPLMQVIPSACNECEPNTYEVSDMCKGCTAHPCVEVCPVGAITREPGHKSVIDQKKCIKCGKCKANCPYDAISHKTRPCAAMCGVSAIETDPQGRAMINPDKCVSCGMCMVSCPFGAIADKSQIFQMIRALQTGQKMIAIVAPAIAGQFGKDVTLGMIKTALMQLGFADVFEVAKGADEGAMHEAKQYVELVASGKVPFLLTSCCPSWAVLAKKYFPETIDKISNTLTPMVSTARYVKSIHPDAHIVFIGPCAAKKLEASRRTIRSDVDFVITFEELDAIFESRMISFDVDETKIDDATGIGRGFAVAGGVAGAIEKCIKEYYPGVEVHIEHAEGLADCRKMLMLAKAGKKNGCLIEGMGCPGGCVAGAGTNIPIGNAIREVQQTVAQSSRRLPELGE
ncbi:MAG: 4Fe-4S dicluster domain-containing protein [Lachnospiraceae bacterium]|nr:4Fe-4S dicluster domain-containing protein [Lachnospiraceae bacterium]